MKKVFSLYGKQEFFTPIREEEGGKKTFGLRHGRGYQTVGSNSIAEVPDNYELMEITCNFQQD